MSEEPRLHLFGVRHHGPGSAASLKAALEALDPEIVLIEAPPEAEPVAAHALLPGMRPPLALLIYAADTPGRANFFPLAEFSPEWIALRYALSRGKPFHFIDEPAAFGLAPPPDSAQESQDTEDTEDADEDEGAAAAEAPANALAPKPFAGDPLDRLAAISGYADGEDLWEALIESRTSSAEVFQAIEEAMTQLRAVSEIEDADPHAEREARREAFMRLAIRKALKDYAGSVACVVGAWHTPALRRKTTQADDKALTRDAPKIKLETCWIPWTEPRLAVGSGYGAGLPAPGWSKHLWRLHQQGGAPDAQRFAADWQSQVAHALRAAGHNVSAASAIEAARLALTLAALRGEATPGVEDMRDASLAALCHGEDALYKVVETRLFIGEGVGAVDAGAPQAPLADDLARWQKKLRLPPQALLQEAAFDLRSEAGLAKSVLLHRLNLLDAPWGRLSGGEMAGRGTFREIWHLEWTPELSVKLAEALIHGVTVAQAASGAAMARAKDEQDIQKLAQLVRQCLLADLPDAAQHAIARMQVVAVGSADIVSLLAAAPPIVNVLRYGVARKMPEAELRALALALCGEAHAGLVHAAQSLEQAEAQRLAEAIAAYDDCLPLLDEAAVTQDWRRALTALLGSGAPAPRVCGQALRRLLESGAITQDETQAHFALRLSAGCAPLDAGLFLEGFLEKNAEIIAQDSALLGMIDAWLVSLDEERFVELLPLLRRALSSFDLHGRRALMQALARADTRVATHVRSEQGALSPAFAQALPLLYKILELRP